MRSAQLERMYCFHDPATTDDTLMLDVVHAHTTALWKDRRSLTGRGRPLSSITSVNARYGRRSDPAAGFQQDRSKLFLVPKNSALQQQWRSLPESYLVWGLDDDSVPPLDAEFAASYESVRQVLRAGEAFCQDAELAYSYSESNARMRGTTTRDGQEVEYEVVACTRKARKDLRVGVDTDAPAAWQDLRAAVLCIGLGEYKHLPVLPNATRDARALCDRVNALPHCLARLLADLPDRRALQKGIRTFLKEPGLQQMPPETVLINYSGHGTQRGGTVYMLPGDADLDDATCEPDADFLPIRDIFKWCREDLDKVARDLDLPRRVTFVLVLDACRVAEMDLATLSSSLEPPPTSAPKKWALCFSCSRDSAASDGPSGSHSPFAQGLLDEDAGIFAAGVPLKGGLEAACRRVSAQHQGQDPIPLLHHIQEDWCLCPGTSPGPVPSPGAAAGTEAMPPAPFSPGSQGSPKKVGAQRADAAGFWQDAFLDADHVPWSLFAAALQDEFDFVQGDAILAQIRDKVDIERNGIISVRAFNIFTRKLGLEGACRAALGTGHAETDTVQVTEGATRVLRGQCGGCGQGVYSDEARRQEGGRYYHDRCSAPCVTAQVSPDSSPRPLGVLSGTGTQEAESEVKGEFAEQSCKEGDQEAAAAEEREASPRTMPGEMPAPSPVSVLAWAMSDAQIKAELRSRGVPEHDIDTCTERRELEDLLNALLLSRCDESSSVEAAQPRAEQQEMDEILMQQQSRLDSAVLTDQGAGDHEAISQFVTSTEAMTVFAHDAADASKYISRGLLKSDSSSCKVCLKKKPGHHGPEFYCVAEADWKCQHCGRVKREHHGVKVYCVHEAEQTCKICAKPRRLHTGAGQYCPYDRVAADAFLRDLPALQQRRSVSVVVEGMRDNVAHRRVQEQACAVLLQLTPGVEGAEWRRIREAAGAEMQDLVAEYKKLADCGVIRAVLQAMEAHAQSAAVAQTGCRILRVLARSDAKEKIAALLGLEAIVQAMGAHADHAGVQEQACGALFSLALNNANKEKVAALLGIEAIVQAMGAHREHAGVQEAACAALSFLAVSNANQEKVAALGGIEAIVQAMGAHREHAGVQEAACAALCNLAAKKDANRTKIKQAGGKEMVKRAVAAPNATPETKELGLRVLKILS
eukprot:Tamp_03342.p1 GENE.Tamp_03342~~Tamp_03342.p1  ORF type:complete len:1150 (-),score=276.67 Tamp_03342:25-3474(-)